MYEDVALWEIRIQNELSSTMKGVLKDCRTLDDLRMVEIEVKGQVATMAWMLRTTGKWLTPGELSALEEAAQVIQLTVVRIGEVVEAATKRMEQMSEIHEHAVRKFNEEVRPVYQEVPIAGKALAVAKCSAQARFNTLWLKEVINRQDSWDELEEFIEYEWDRMLRHIGQKFGLAAVGEFAESSGARLLADIDAALHSSEDLLWWELKLKELRAHFDAG